LGKVKFGMRDEQKKRKLKKFLLIAGAVLMTVLLGYACFYTFTRSKLDNFTVKATGLTCTDEGMIGKFLKDLQLNYFAFDQSELSDKLKQKFFCIGKINTEVSFPNKLTIETEGRKAEFAAVQVLLPRQPNPLVELPADYQIATESSQAAVPVKILDRIVKDVNESSNSAYFLIDSEGVIFDQGEGTINFPVLRITGEELKIGGRVQGDLIGKIKQALASLTNIEGPTDKIIVIGDKLIIDSKPRLIFSLNKRLDYQATSLQLILTQAKMSSDPSKPGSGDIESIDLRFNKPVVVYGKR